jgi:hypothetical protein
MPHSSDLVVYATADDGRSITIEIDRDELLHFVCDRLLPLYNEVWRLPQLAEELDSESFRARLTLPEGSVECSLSTNDTAEIYVDADGLFTDHKIVVLVDRTGQLRHAHIE